MSTSGGWRQLLSEADWEDVDRRRLEALLPEHTSAARFLHAVCEGPLLGGSCAVRTAGHIARLLGPHRTRRALLWFLVLGECEAIGSDATAHALTVAAAVRVLGDGSSEENITLGLAAGLVLRTQLPRTADLAVGLEVLAPLHPAMRAATERAVFGRSRSEQAMVLALALDVPADLRELVAPRAGSDRWHLAEEALLCVDEPGPRWAAVQRESRHLAAALGVKVTVPWVGTGANSVSDDDVSAIGRAIREHAGALNGRRARGRPPSS